MVELVSIAAVGANGVIGNSKENEMPWRLGKYAEDDFYKKIFRQADMAHFKQITGSHPLIMGKNTWLSIPKKYRPLKGRENIVLSTSMKLETGVHIYSSLEDAMHYVNQFEQVAIIGGSQLYLSTLSFVNRLEITRLNESFKGDIFFPEINEREWFLSSSVDKFNEEYQKGFSFQTYLRR